MNIASDIHKSIISAIGTNNAELHVPKFDLEDRDYVTKCLESGFVSSVGKFVTLLEEKVKTYVGTKNAIAVNSGTSGLHALLHSCGADENTEIILPSISFIATANSVKYCGSEPHFVDVDPYTLNICPQILKIHLKKICKFQNGETLNRFTNKKILGVMAVHVFGRPPQLDKLSQICKEFGLFLFEDAAAALGSKYNGRHIGNYSDAAVVSFNGNKIITGGSGGLILTNNTKLADSIRHITTTAKVPHPWEYKHDVVGFNYRMANLNAALVLSQFNKLNQIIDKKKNLLSKYIIAFENSPYGKIVEDPENIESNNWLINLRLRSNFSNEAEKVISYLNIQQVKCRPVWYPLHLQSQFLSAPKGQLNNAENCWRKFISLPSSEY